MNLDWLFGSWEGWILVVAACIALVLVAGVVRSSFGTAERHDAYRRNHR